MNNLCIIILTFNEEINIKKCLESIKDFADEIIIIDSYSTDNTKSICENYKVSLSKINLLIRPNNLIGLYQMLKLNQNG